MIKDNFNETDVLLIWDWSITPSAPKQHSTYCTYILMHLQLQNAKFHSKKQVIRASLKISNYWYTMVYSCIPNNYFFLVHVLTVKSIPSRCTTATCWVYSPLTFIYLSTPHKSERKCKLQAASLLLSISHWNDKVRFMYMIWWMIHLIKRMDWHIIQLQVYWVWRYHDVFMELTTTKGKQWPMIWNASKTNNFSNQTKCGLQTHQVLEVTY